MEKNVETVFFYKVKRRGVGDREAKTAFVFSTTAVMLDPIAVAITTELLLGWMGSTIIVSLS